MGVLHRANYHTENPVCLSLPPLFLLPVLSFYAGFSVLDHRLSGDLSIIPGCRCVSHSRCFGSGSSSSGSPASPLLPLCSSCAWRSCLSLPPCVYCPSPWERCLRFAHVFTWSVFFQVPAWRAVCVARGCLGTPEEAPHPSYIYNPCLIFVILIAYFCPSVVRPDTSSIIHAVKGLFLHPHLNWYLATQKNINADLTTRSKSERLKENNGSVSLFPWNNLSRVIMSESHTCSLVWDSPQLCASGWLSVWTPLLHSVLSLWIRLHTLKKRS